MEKRFIQEFGMRYSDETEKIELNEELDFIGKGKERTCYAHPNKPDVAIKITHGEVDKQTTRELRYYQKLGKRVGISYKHFPRYLGPVNTSLGLGHMYDLVRDFDGGVSKSLLEYLENGSSLNDFELELEELKIAFLENEIIFNHDMYAGNILFKRTSSNKGCLVVIDGLGDTVLIPLFDRFKAERKRKIRRRWTYFINRIRTRHPDIR